MNIDINLSKKYKIYLEKNSIKKLRSFIRQSYPKAKIAVITDDKVKSLHFDKLENELVGRNYSTFILKNGEDSKNTSNLISILEFLAENNFKREDLLIAFGGGVIGDIGGFAAGVYLRGIDFIQIPTTFLSAIDSSIGGKTAVNLNAGKNLMGIFNQPSAVFIDRNFLKTLSDHDFSDGVAEAIKYGMIKDEKIIELFEKEEINQSSSYLDEIIYRSLIIKKEVCEEDEFDKGLRQILNYGHTFGHAIEKVSKLKISHGHAVAVGMLIMVRYFYKSYNKDFEKLLDKYGLLRKIDFPLEKIIEYTKRDKKSFNDFINIIVVRKKAHAKIEKVSYEKLGNIYEQAKD